MVLILATVYAFTALPGYFWYHFKKEHSRHFDSDISLLLLPLVLYTGLYFVEDRQGFFAPLALAIIGACMSFYFLLCYFIPGIDGHHLSVSFLVLLVVVCWIFVPESRMRMM